MFQSVNEIIAVSLLRTCFKILAQLWPFAAVLFCKAAARRKNMPEISRQTILNRFCRTPHLMGTTPAASILRHFQPSRTLRQKSSPRLRGAAMELATERDAKWLSSVVCYEILSAGSAGKLLARKPGDHRATKMQAKAQASCLTSRSSNDHEFGPSAGLIIVRLRLRLAAL